MGLSVRRYDVKIGLTLLALILFPIFCHADCAQKAEAAKRFMSEYKAYCDTGSDGKSKSAVVTWVQKNQGVTDAFKSAHKKLVLDARKKDPEMGLGFDPIFDAQDYPDKGFKILACDDRSGLVTLQGVDWADYKVVVKVIKTDNRLLIDGAGVINIPKKSRAPRD
jgi:hypothetical protein